MVTTTASLGERFARLMLSKDWIGLSSILDADVDVCGLTPGRHWEADGSAAAIERVFQQWFETTDDIYEVLDVATDRVVDRERVVYRARIRNPDGDFVCEQTAYFDTANGRISKLCILCSGYRPTAGQSTS